jgi:hypothetical protein
MQNYDPAAILVTFINTLGQLKLFAGPLLDMPYFALYLVRIRHKIYSCSGSVRGPLETLQVEVLSIEDDKWQQRIEAGFCRGMAAIIESEEKARPLRFAGTFVKKPHF